MAVPKLTAKERHFRSLMAERAKSGLSMARFARSRGIPEGTFAWWSSEIRRREEMRRGKTSESGESGDVTFVPVQIVPDEVRPVAATRSAPRFEVILAGGAKVRIAGAPDEESVACVLRAVVASC